MREGLSRRTPPVKLLPSIILAVESDGSAETRSPSSHTAAGLPNNPSRLSWTRTRENTVPSANPPVIGGRRLGRDNSTREQESPRHFPGVIAAVIVALYEDLSKDFARQAAVS